MSTESLLIAVDDGVPSCAFDDEARAKAFITRRNDQRRKMNKVSTWKLVTVPYNSGPMGGES